MMPFVKTLGLIYALTAFFFQFQELQCDFGAKVIKMSGMRCTAVTHMVVRLSGLQLG